MYVREYVHRIAHARTCLCARVTASVLIDIFSGAIGKHARSYSQRSIVDITTMLSLYSFNEIRVRTPETNLDYLCPMVYHCRVMARVFWWVKGCGGGYIVVYSVVGHMLWGTMWLATLCGFKFCGYSVVGYRDVVYSVGGRKL